MVESENVFFLDLSRPLLASLSRRQREARRALDRRSEEKILSNGLFSSLCHFEKERRGRHEWRTKKHRRLTRGKIRFKENTYFFFVEIHSISLLCSLLYPATPESGSPGQAPEAEEIMKQLETVVEEMPTSTPASTEGIVLSSVTPAPLAPPPQQPPLATPEPLVEEGEMVTDMPPLTGNRDIGCS